MGRLLAGQDTAAATSVAFAVARAVQFGAIGVALGLVVFAPAVWLPALAAVAGGTDPWLAASAAFSTRLHRALLVAPARGTRASGSSR